MKLIKDINNTPNRMASFNEASLICVRFEYLQQDNDKNYYYKVIYLEGFYLM